MVRSSDGWTLPHFDLDRAVIWQAVDHVNREMRWVGGLALGALIGVSRGGGAEALVLFYAVSLIFALLVAYETVVERESLQRIRSDETATWSYRILSERPPTHLARSGSHGLRY